MVNFKLPLLGLALMVAVISQAQTTVISGQAPENAGKQLLVYADADPLSQKQVMLHHTRIDDNAEFEFELENDETTPIRIFINHVSGTMVAQPDGEYSIIFPPLAEDQDRSFSGTTYTELIFTSLPADNINAVVSDINYAVDSLLMANVSLIGSKHFLPKLTDLEEQLQQRFGNTEDPYLSQHLKFTLAITEFSTRSFTRYDLYQRHLEDGNWQMHPTFFDFLRSYFQRYFKRFEANYGVDLVKPALQKESPGAALLEVMQKDDLLQNDTLRELVAIHALMESYHTDLRPKRVVAALRDISESGETAFVRKAAGNAIDVLTATSVGFKAPEISGLNQYNKSVSLEDFGGKYVYLEFISTWCTDCKREQSILPDLRAEYGDVVEIITVVVDSPREEFQQYLANNSHYDWNIIYDDSGFENINKYRVRSLPMYFLIGPEGKFELSPAPSPSDGIVERLYPILQKAQEEQRLKVGDK